MKSLPPEIAHNATGVCSPPVSEGTTCLFINGVTSLCTSFKMSAKNSNVNTNSGEPNTNRHRFVIYYLFVLFPVIRNHEKKKQTCVSGQWNLAGLIHSCILPDTGPWHMWISNRYWGWNKFREKILQMKRKTSTLTTPPGGGGGNKPRVKPTLGCFVDPVDRMSYWAWNEQPREKSNFQSPSVGLSVLTHMTLPFITVPSHNSTAMGKQETRFQES